MYPEMHLQTLRALVTFHGGRGEHIRVERATPKDNCLTDPNVEQQRHKKSIFNEIYHPLWKSMSFLIYLESRRDMYFHHFE